MARRRVKIQTTIFAQHRQIIEAAYPDHNQAIGWYLLYHPDRENYPMPVKHFEKWLGRYHHYLPWLEEARRNIVLGQSMIVKYNCRLEE